MDIIMPDVSGLEVLHFIRSNTESAKILVVVVSTMGLPSDMQDGLAADVTSYLIKPVGYQECKRL